MDREGFDGAQSVRRLAVEGSVVDFESGLQAAGFHVQNPNVESECGCGESFRT